jgi:hypothetical protein
MMSGPSNHIRNVVWCGSPILAVGRITSVLVFIVVIKLTFIVIIL